MRRHQRRALIVCRLEERAVPAIFTVTNTSDSNTANSGSLRRAITDANNNPGADTIQFNIPGSGVHTIEFNNTRTIDEAVLIDGWSQPGFTTTPLIEITANGKVNNGLNVENGSTTLQGLIVNGFDDYGIFLDGGSDNVVRGCWIGTDSTGKLDAGNTWGVAVRNSANATIGGTTAKDRNVISGNDLENVVVWGPQADGTRIIGNYIGTDSTGLAAIGGTRGVWLGDTVPPTIGSPDHITVGGVNPGERNVIGGNTTGVLNTLSTFSNLVQGNFIGVGADGKTLVANTYGVVADAGASSITIDRNTIAGKTVGGGGGIYGQAVLLGGTTGPSSNNVVIGNLIGTADDGLTKLGQLDHGVVMFNGSNNRIGGATAAERNVIAGVVFDCVGMYGASAFGNVVGGNFIGTDISGTKALAGDGRGVWLGDNYPPSVGAAHDNLVTDNVIGGQGLAGVLLTYGANKNTVQGNFIGTDVSGTVNLGNLFGVFVEINSTNNTIGGSSPGAGNVIAFSQMDGVLVGYDKKYSGQMTLAGPGNRISGNSIHDNGKLGIDLGSDDNVSPNDVLDADGGANLMQNYPVLVSAKSGPTTLVSGVLKSAANSTYTLEFFASKNADGTGNGEGGRFLGTATVTTDGTGRAMFIDATLTAATASGEVITATATSATGDTSEFSNAMALDVTPRVASVVINGGATQRSRVTALTVNFNQFVTLPGSPATAFRLRRLSDGTTIGLTPTVANDTYTSVSFTFSGPTIETTSLADGRYELTAYSASIGNANGSLDGDANGVSGDDYVLVGDPALAPKLFRLFGDTTGDGITDLFDFVLFRQANGATGFNPPYNPAFDFNGDGNIDLVDFIQFRTRVGTVI